MKIIGLTGGIGSGKTTVSGCFKSLGAAVFTSDTEAKIIQDSHPEAIAKQKKLFGDDIYSPDGTLDRKRVAAVVFSDETMLKALNNIIHPLVKQSFDKFLEENKDKDFVVLETAILISSGFYKFADFSVLVTADFETRISRVMSRDNATREQVLQRIKNQQQDDEIMKFCKYKIINNDINTLESQVKQILTENR